MTAEERVRATELIVALVVELLFEALRSEVRVVCETIEQAPDTVRQYGAPWDGDCAPSTPRGSALGEEYGV